MPFPVCHLAQSFTPTERAVGIPCMTFMTCTGFNHSVAFSKDGSCTNQAESYFSRLRRAEFGQHHRISGQYLHCYASGMTWREDNPRVPNGAQYDAITALALCHPISREWCGYWQRSAR
jgi:hypothetical protein